MKKYKIALVIGRFQPFHKGHLYLIKEALKIADKVIIEIGSINLSDLDNPYTYEERLKMVKNELKKENLEKRVIRIVGTEDNPDDQVWFEESIKAAGSKFDVVLGNNEWANYKFREAGYPVIEIPFYKRNIYEGKKIREKLRNNKRDLF